MMTDAQIIAKYGKPGDPDQLTIITLPYPMRIAWDLSTTVHKIQCHKLIATNLIGVFNDLLISYGIDQIKKSRIDLFGGCVNVRLMRGSTTKWSRHSWGIAIDLDPERNQLHQHADTAEFARPEYNALINIFYSHGFFNLGKEKNYDWMHFEINS